MIGDILQPTHLLFILVVALLVLGPKRLPEAGRALGKGLRDFRSAMSGDDDHRSEIPTETPAPPVEYLQPAAPQTQPVTYAETPPATYVEPTTPAPPPADHAIQAAVYAATPAVDATVEPAEPVEHPAESARSVG